MLQHLLMLRSVDPGTFLEALENFFGILFVSFNPEYLLDNYEIKKHNTYLISVIDQRV